MYASVVVVAIVVALVMALNGSLKIAGHSTMARNAHHLGFSRTSFSYIGGLEVAAGLGLLIGLRVTPLRIVTAIAVCALMIGAIVVHVRVDRSFKPAIPAAVFAVLAGFVAAGS